VKTSVTKNGRSAGMKMAMITLEDLDGQIDGVLFAENYAEACEKYPDAVKLESIVFIKGKIDKRRETPSIIVNEVIPVADAVQKLTTGVMLKLDHARHTPDLIPQLKPVLGKHSGKAEIYLQVTMPDAKKVAIKLRETGLKPSAQLLSDLQMVVGDGNVQWIGQGTKRIRKIEQQRLFKEETPDVTPDEIIPSLEMVADEL